MNVTVKKWGNSQAIRIPKAISDTLGIKENENVEIVAENDTIVIKKISRKRRAKKSFEQRLEEYYHKPIEEILSDDTLYEPTEYDFGNPVGREVW